MADEHPPLATHGTDTGSPVEPPAPAVRKVPSRWHLRRPKVRKRIAIPIAAVLLVVIGAVLWRYFSSYESTDDAQADVHLSPVSARVSGHVLRVNVDDNQWVELGTVLVELDPRDFEVAVAQAQASLDGAEATSLSLDISVPIASVSTSSQLTSAAADIENTRAGVIAAERQLLAAHAQLVAAEANDVKAQDDLRRYGLLRDRREVAEQVYDSAAAAAKSSTAAVAAARANESAAQQFVQQARGRQAQAAASHLYAKTGPQQVSSTQARARAAVADMEQKRALLEQARLNLTYTKIVAPVSGQVNKTVVPGMNVQAGQQLLTVVPLDEVWVTANFKETQLEHMRVGQKAAIHVDATGRTLRGHVDSFAGATGPVFSLLPPENATGNYVKIVQRVPVKIVLEPGENKDRSLRPGMNVVTRVFLR